MRFLDKRPWGWMFKFIHTRHCWIKLIHVIGRTSLQSHKQRTEYHLSFWCIKKINPLEKHRMEPGWYIEYAHGIPTEEDIVRYQDDYGRT